MQTLEFAHRAPLRRACQLLGSQTALANAVGASPMQVHYWLTRDKNLDAAHCVAIEQATGGQVTRKDLRPHDWQRYWPELEKA